MLEKDLEQLVEETLDPSRPIVDPHHHLWVRPGSRYLLDEFLADIAPGHDIRATVFVQCRTMYRQDGPEELKPLGETEFVNGIAAMSASGSFGPTRVGAGIVGYADLMLGDAVEEVLARHVQTAGKRFRGVRYMLIWDADPKVALDGYPMVPGRAADPRFRAGVSTLGRMGLSLDTLAFHTQLGDIADLADACPDVSIVLNHVGLPVNMGLYRQNQAEVLSTWKAGLRRLAERPNIVLKVGGLGVHWFGLGFKRGDRAPSERIAEAWRPYVETCIELFGHDRCMFESNFPVDGMSVTYHSLWNAFKRLTHNASDTEKTALFGGTATRVYGLDVDGF